MWNNGNGFKLPPAGPDSRQYRRAGHTQLSALSDEVNNGYQIHPLLQATACDNKAMFLSKFRESHAVVLLARKA